jgi:predicted protein tyrosine phosphatase
MFRQLPAEALKTFYDIPSRNLYNRAVFPISKMFTDAKVATSYCSEWDEVEEGLFLGKLPHVSECDLLKNFVVQTQEKKILDGAQSHPVRPLKLIVSAVDYFELAGSFLLGKMATPKDWLEKDVNQVSLPIQDFGADVSDECIVKTIFEMRKCILEGNAVYVHCKAGRGRSAMLCAIYLAVFDEKYSNLEVTEAFVKILEQLKAKRSEVKLDDIKQSKAKKVIQHVRNLLNGLGSDTDNLPENNKDKSGKSETFSDVVNRSVMKALLMQEMLKENPPVVDEADLSTELSHYLASPAAKLAISEMTYFKELAIYAAYYDAAISGTTERCEMVKSLFASIYSADNADWFINILDPAGPLQLLKRLSPPSEAWLPNISRALFASSEKSYAEIDSRDRYKLVNGFIDELTLHLSKQFFTSPSKIKELLPRSYENECKKAFAL